MHRSLRPVAYLMFSVAVALLAMYAPVGGPPLPTSARAASLESDSYVQQLITLLNQERLAAGVPELTLTGDINAVAAARALDMAANNYFAHISPSGIGPQETLESFRIPFRRMGENIAMSTYQPGQVIEVIHGALMASQGHRDNMLNPYFGRVGIAVASERGTFYVVQVFLD